MSFLSARHPAFCGMPIERGVTRLRSAVRPLLARPGFSPRGYTGAAMLDEPSETALRQALEALERTGLLLLHDARKPSLTALVAGAPIRGSWWGHPAGRRIFQVANALEGRGDVLFVPLLSAKVTLVHRRLWPALVSVGEAREPWQVKELEARARALLEEVEQSGRVRATGPSSKALARALLVHARAGAHRRRLDTPRSWWPGGRSASTGHRRAGHRERGSRGARGSAEQLGATSALPWRRSR